MLAIQILCTLLVAIAGFVCLYHIFLAGVAPLVVAKSRRDQANPTHRFAILIPAHDEEETLGATLRSCAALHYPNDKYRVVVVADNCNDATAEVAIRGGAKCLVRQDEKNQGKGHALEWALPQVLDEPCDAVVVLDADCRLDERALRHFDARLATAAGPLQAGVVISNPDDNALSYMLAIANTLENDLFYAPKSALGLSVSLRGTGMVLPREMLRRHPWRARAITEDTEYSFQLLRHGTRVEFVPEVRVWSETPASGRRLAVQRSRWIGGGAEMAKKQGMALLWEGFRQRQLRLLDAALCVWIVSRPLVLAQLFSALLVALACWLFVGDRWSGVLLASSVGVFAAYGLYAAVGALWLGLTRRRVWLLIKAPAAIVRYLGLAAKAWTLSRPSAWTRTPRLVNVSGRDKPYEEVGELNEPVTR